MGNHHSHDATLKEFSIDTQTVVATQDDSWDLYNGLHHAAPVSVFVAKKATSTVDTFAQNLRRYRHPDILRFINWTQTSDSASQLTTERVVPLVKVLEQQNKHQICLGLQKIAKALDFLHNVAKVSHGNITLSSIFVTPNGHWKLAGLTKTAVLSQSKTNDDVSDYCKLVESTTSDPGETDDGSLEFVKLLQLKPSFDQILSSAFFELNDLVQVDNFIADLPMKSHTEREHFFAQKLLERLRNLPVNLIASQLAHQLLSRMILLDSNAVKHFLPRLLSPQSLDGDGILPDHLYKEHIPPILINILQVRELQIRLVLLRFFPLYVSMFSEEQLEKSVLPLILLGIKDSSDEIVGETLKALALMVPLLGAHRVIGKRRKKVFADGSPSETCKVNQEEDVRQSPIGAETSDDDLPIPEDWDAWEDEEVQKEDEPSLPVEAEIDEPSQQHSPSIERKKSVEDDDFFADMQPVIKGQDVIEINKFAVMTDDTAQAEETDYAENGWNSDW